MKTHIKHQLEQAIIALQQKEGEQFNIESLPTIQVMRSKDPQHGDFFSNIAMILGKALNRSPREFAEQLVHHLSPSDQIANIEIAGPGFINFTLSTLALEQVIVNIVDQKQKYGHATLGAGKRIYLEFVSANPTGPLHVGHGRSAAYSACVANLLQAIGYTVHREYYVNDVGRQMRILALSTWLRYLQELGVSVDFPTNAYQGDYITVIAKELHIQHAQNFYQEPEKIKQLLEQYTISSQKNDNEPPSDDKEGYIDAYINIAIQLLGQENFDVIRQTTLENILADIKADLSEFGVTFDEWFHESNLAKLGLIDEGINLLRKHGYVYERDGATWFMATHFGDEKDRVLTRENGQTTYFASDVAYHLYKYQQNHDLIIDVFGADHHGYVARINAFLQGLGEDTKKLKIILVQFASLYRGKQKIQMSTRSGSFVTLRELREDVGNDAARFFYIMRKPEQHLDFDLELAKAESSENPVYYIQYAHARICSVWEQLAKLYPQESKMNDNHTTNLSLLNSTYEKDLLRHLVHYAETLSHAAENYEPHTLAHYLYELANFFHSYYNAEKFLVPENDLRHARLYFIRAIQQILANGLNLLGLSTPEKM